MCKFLVVPGMPDIDMLNIININCNTISMHGNGSTDNYSTNTTTYQSSKYVQHYTHTMQNVDRAVKSCANIDVISKFENKDKPTVIDNEPDTISYFLPCHNHNNDKRASL